MHFTRLRLNGFKSFVDPTDLVIHEGLTGVVGPNGCGKSNLLEALRWVMGENRPTAMRGGGMEDVIFGGAASRRARNFAEVTLQVDNADRRAPPAFNDSDQIEIVRRITRDAGSAYKAGGRDVRARDVQMLFADASTGSHSPALVRQGQISELISARPKARRRILEEAAGISGLYQRRQEAEVKLKGAEANLLRVADVIEQLAAQLTQLARQARQAARYREIGDALRRAEGLLLYRRWASADAGRRDAEAALGARASEAAEAERAAVAAAEGRAGAEAALPPLREEDGIAAAIVRKAEAERASLAERIRRAEAGIGTLSARLAQLDRDAARETALNADAAETVARLEAEDRTLAAAAEGFDEDLAGAADEARAAADILSAREGDMARMTEDLARLSARHQSAARAVQDQRAALDRAEAGATRARGAASEADAALHAAAAGFTAAETERTAAQDLAQRAEAALTAMEDARARLQARERTARSARSEVEGALGTVRSEVQALDRILSRGDGGETGLLDSIEVARGYEAALGAALADDLRLPLRETGSGWRELPDRAAPQALPAGAAPLGSRVTGPAALARRIAQVGIVEASYGARLQHDLRPGQRLVSREGDLWRWDGFSLAARDAPSATALRMQQANRLRDLREELSRLETGARDAVAEHDRAQARLAEVTGSERDARAARREADARLAELGRSASRAEAERSVAAGKLESARLAVARHEEEAGVARAALGEAQTALEGLADLEAARARMDDIRLTVDAARMTMMARRSAHDELQREGAARDRRRADVARELAAWNERGATADARLGDLAQRRHRTEADLAEARSMPAKLAGRRDTLDRDLAAAETRRDGAVRALSEGEARLQDAARTERESERAAGAAREARAAAGAQAEAARSAVAAAEARMADALDLAPGDLLARLGVDPESLPEAEEIEREVTALRQKRDAMGAVNLRAEEDAAEARSEHDLLVGERADLEQAIAELRRGIAGLNREGRERLLAAFERVDANFSMLFTHLFGGGEARLELVESDDPLDAGLEIMCCPPGKRLSTLSLLSGGEQTLTAMALIFAVFLANPAPICVLDEVDAPLDDANVTRFCDMLDEMTRRTDTRFLIITHHAVTMARMDRLFGVTMAEQGVSQLVSVDLRRAEALVA